MGSTNVLPRINMYEVKEKGQEMEAPGQGKKYGFLGRERIASFPTSHWWDD